MAACRFAGNWRSTIAHTLEERTAWESRRLARDGANSVERSAACGRRSAIARADPAASFNGPARRWAGPIAPKSRERLSPRRTGPSVRADTARHFVPACSASDRTSRAERHGGHSLQAPRCRECPPWRSAPPITRSPYPIREMDLRFAPPPALAHVAKSPRLNLHIAHCGLWLHSRDKVAKQFLL